MRVLARNMSFLMKSIALGREQFGLPEKEERVFLLILSGKAGFLIISNSYSQFLKQKQNRSMKYE